MGESYTQSDIINYFYNAQKPIPMKLKKDGIILLNGKEFPIDKLSFNPHHPSKYISGTFKVFPHPFPGPFTIKIGNEKYERAMLIFRISNNSVSVAKFESDLEDVLRIQYLLDEKNQNLSLNLSYDLLKAKSIRDIVEGTSIYNSFLDGNAIFCGFPLNNSTAKENGKKFEPQSVIFWEKVLKIEEKLNVNFIPPQEDIDYETICIVEQLYQNLINHLPVRKNEKIASLDGDYSFEKDNDLENLINTPIYFEFEATFDLDLFGVTMKIPAIIGIFNAVVSGVEKDNVKYKVLLSDEAEEKIRYTSTICFANEGDLASYRNGDRDIILTEFHDAKSANDYLNEQSVKL